MAQNEYKITVLGAGGVGKSALTIRLITGTFESNYDPTIEDSYRKHVTIDDSPALMDILDTAGQEEYAALQDQWIREGDGFLLVYAIDSTDSFDEVDIIRNKIVRILDADPMNPDIPIVLVGNKCDLDDKDRVINIADGQTKSKEWNCPFLETSAKTKKNVDECFYNVVRQIRKKKGQNIPNNDNNKNKKKNNGNGFKCIIL